MTLVEIAIAVALLGLVAAGAIASLIALNKNAVSTRVMSSAREIVQRNIEAAMGAPFSSTVEPDILTKTSSQGVAWNDDGSGNPVAVYTSRDGKTVITGSLKRAVVAQANSASADLRRITFHLDYILFGRNLSYEVTTVRAMDR